MRRGDIVTVDLGLPEGSEAGFRRPAVVVTAGVVLGRGARVVQVVPLTRADRRYATELAAPAGESGLRDDSVAQAHHPRAGVALPGGPPVGTAHCASHVG